jgi:plastocyanin
MSTSAPVISRRRLMAAAAVALPMVGLAKMIGSDDVGAADVAVNIVNFTFNPSPLTIPVGTTVVWTNQDTAPHTATSDPGSAFTFDTGNLQKGQSGRVTFNTAGTFTYFCKVHPNMHGTVIVTAAGGTANAASPSASAPSASAPSTVSTTAVPTATRAATPTTAPPSAPNTGGGALANGFIRRLGDG